MVSCWIVGTLCNENFPCKMSKESFKVYSSF